MATVSQKPDRWLVHTKAKVATAPKKTNRRGNAGHGATDVAQDEGNLLLGMIAYLVIALLIILLFALATNGPPMEDGFYILP